MEKITIKEDIPVICVRADSFPGDVKGAYEKLYSSVPDPHKRVTYGLSFMENGKLVYKAAFNRMVDDDPEKLGMETDIIYKGEYIAETIHDFENHRDQFQGTFQKLGDSDLKTEVRGVEWYQGKDVKCMLPLKK